MASPPPPGGYYARSPPAPNSMALPRQRPGIALPTPSAPMSRKPSGASSATLSAHPLRQSSFPPEYAPRDTTRAYSPEDPELASADDVSDSEIMGPASSMSGPSNTGATGNGTSRGIKRKRGQHKDKKGPGRPSTKDRSQAVMRGSSASVADGDTGRKRGGNRAPSTTAGGNNNAATNAASPGANDDESDEEETRPTDRHGKPTGPRETLYTLNPPFTRADQHADSATMALFRNTVEGAFRRPNHARRFDYWRQGKLKTGEVRKVVNQTLSQSVPGPVVTTVGAFAKMFATGMVESARGVQGEWAVLREKRGDGELNPANKRLKTMQGVSLEATPARPETSGQDGHVPQSQDTDPDVQIIDPPPPPTNNSTNASDSPPKPTKLSQTPAPAVQAPQFSPPQGPQDPNLGLASLIAEVDRGPLTPDHLREALRRYKKRTVGGVVGFTGISLQGKEGTGARNGGRPLFR